jgi:V8-like Glu-specific endopeptidase
MPDINLSHDEKRRLIDELCQLPAWMDGGIPGERRVLIDAGLPRRYVYDWPLTGVPATDATLVVAALCSIGHLVNRPTHRALGALVEYLLQHSPHVEGKFFLASLIERHDLIADPAYRERLRQTYGLLERPLAADTVDLGWRIAQPKFSWQGPSDPADLERIWSRRAPFLDAVFLEDGARVARAVCRVETIGSGAIGTGFLIGPDLVLTNHHVAYHEGQQIAAQVRFGYRKGPDGALTSGLVLPIDSIVRASPPDDLDYALLHLSSVPTDVHYLPLVAGDLRPGMPVYVIQHPNGKPQKVVLQDNQVTHVDDDSCRVQYLANTEHGSSGSPVCNEKWQVIALHHSGSPHPRSWWKTFIRGNEGIPMAAILPQIEDLLPAT